MAAPFFMGVMGFMGEMGFIGFMGFMGGAAAKQRPTERSPPLPSKCPCLSHLYGNKKGSSLTASAYLV